MTNLGPLAANQPVPRTALAPASASSFVIYGNGQAPLPGNIVIATGESDLWLYTTINVAGRSSGSAPVLISGSLSLTGNPTAVGALYYNVDGGAWTKLHQFYWNTLQLRQLAGQQIVSMSAGSHTVYIGWSIVDVFGGSIAFTSGMGNVTLIEL